MLNSGTAALYFLPGNTAMNGAKYVEVFQEELLHMNIHKCTLFTEHHATGAVKLDYFKPSERSFVLGWTGNSRALNPTENLWNLMKNKISKRHPSSKK